MIRFICGMPGAGKGLYATRIITEELAQGSRDILTNLDLDVGRLNEYMQEKFPDKDCRTVQRVTILTDDQVRSFWLHRGDGNGTVEVVDKSSLRFSGTRGVLFLIDETQNFFNARAWQNTGFHAMFYLSQHRHLGDDVWLCSQSMKNIDCQMRSLAQDTFLLRNYSLEKRGWFRGPAMFRWSQFLGGQPGRQNEAVASAFFRLDVEGLASCYRTAGGVGIPGDGTADKGSRKPGLPFWLVPVGLVGLILSFWGLVTVGFPSAVAKFGPAPARLRGGPGAASNSAPAVVPVPAAPSSPGIVPGVPSSPGVQVVREVPVPVREDEPQRITGYAQHGEMVTLYFEDGSDGRWPLAMVRPGSNGVLLEAGGERRYHKFVLPQRQAVAVTGVNGVPGR